MSYRALAAAIRKGIPLAPEGRLFSECCAVGTAFLAVKGRRFDYFVDVVPPFSWAVEAIAHALNVPVKIVEDASDRHYRGIRGSGPRYTREQIADWLDSLEAAPAKPTDAEVTAKFIADMTKAVEKGEVIEYAKV